MAKKKLTPQQVWELDVIAGAVAWTAYVQVGPFDKRKVEVATRADAMEAAHQLQADTGRRPMIYAINAAGRCVMVGSLTNKGDFASAVAAA